MKYADAGQADAGSIVANTERGFIMPETETGNENNVPGDAVLETSGNDDANTGVGDAPAGDAAQDQDAKLNAAITMANTEKEKRQTAESEAKAAQDQVAILSAAPKSEVQGSQKSLYVQLAEKRGIDPEYPTPEENGLIMQDMLQMNNVQNEQTTFIASHPDYSEVVGTSLPNGAFSIAPPLKRVIASNPALASKIMNLDPAIAYQLAVTDPTYQKELADNAKPADIKAAEKAEAAIKAAAQKASVSNAGGGGNLDKAGEIAAMSDEDFDKHVEKIKSEA